MQRSNKSKRKKQVIVNIQELNKITIIDFYSMFLQSNVTLAIIDYVYISIFNVVEFFYQ